MTAGIYDAGGRLLQRLAPVSDGGGILRAVWDGRSSDGRPVPAGVYFCRIKAKDMEISHSILRLR
ncbi:MAG: hypothetical protein GF355_02490 [Candidatus Eisenbacteria bacterium]|nr:hypothetical protein [Candidatus Eisenbacteria bacterium]